MIGGFTMSEKLDKLRATLKKEQERRIKLNNRIAVLERRIQEEEAAEVNEMVRVAKLTPEQLAALLRQSANTTPNPDALAAVGATFEKEEDTNDEI
jgi:septal ring factor EnvC (AmiA/AmiB activator)